MKVNHGGDWINVGSTGEDHPLPLDARAPPRQVNVGGQRFKIDEKERYVEWMDFNFFITYVYLSEWPLDVRTNLTKQIHSGYWNEIVRCQVQRWTNHIW